MSYYLDKVDLQAKVAARKRIKVRVSEAVSMQVHNVAWCKVIPAPVQQDMWSRVGLRVYQQVQARAWRRLGPMLQQFRRGGNDR